MNENYEESELDALRRFNQEYREKLGDLEAEHAKLREAYQEQNEFCGELLSQASNRLRALDEIRTDLARALHWDPDTVPAEPAGYGMLVGAVRMLRDLAGPTELTVEHDGDLDWRGVAGAEIDAAAQVRKASALTVVSNAEKRAGIDRRAKCGYTWEGEPTDWCDGGAHECQLIDPLHQVDHACDERYCGQTLSVPAAEALEEAKRESANQ